jgi:hypothetical protein
MWEPPFTCSYEVLPVTSIFVLSPEVNIGALILEGNSFILVKHGVKLLICNIT